MAASLEPSIPGLVTDCDRVTDYDRQSEVGMIPDSFHCAPSLTFAQSCTDDRHLRPPEGNMPFSLRLSHMEEVLDRVELQLSSLQEMPFQLSSMFGMVASLQNLTSENAQLTSWVATAIEESLNQVTSLHTKKSSSAGYVAFSGDGDTIRQSGAQAKRRASVVSRLHHPSISSNHVSKMSMGLDRASVVSMASTREDARSSIISQAGLEHRQSKKLMAGANPGGGAETSLGNGAEKSLDDGTDLSPILPSGRQASPEPRSDASDVVPKQLPDTSTALAPILPIGKQATPEARSDASDVVPKQKQGVCFSAEVQAEEVDGRDWLALDESDDEGPSARAAQFAAASSASASSQSLQRTKTVELTRHRDDLRKRVTDSAELVHYAKCVVSPISTWRLIWDAAIVFITIISGLLTPMVLVYFERDRDSINGLDMLLYFFDVFWILDVIIKFRTGFFKDGHLINDAGHIATHYARGWLVPDVLAMWPLLLMWKDSIGYVIVCFMKGCRFLQLGTRMQALQSGTLSDRLLPAGVLVASTLGIHFLACIWRGTRNWEEKQCLFYCTAEIHEAAWPTLYVEDMYFVTTTLSSVGYGDITPGGNMSRCLSIFLMLLGSAVFGACITGASMVFRSLVEDEVTKKTAEITRFMGRRSVDQKMQRRVRDNLRQCLSSGASSSMVPIHILECLSPAMRRELCLCLVSDTFYNFPLFRGTQHSFLADLAQAQNWQQILPGDLVADHGQSVQEIIFVMAGELHALIDGLACGQIDVQSDDGEMCNHLNSYASSETRDDEVMRLPAGSWIGETSLLTNDRIYSAIITAVVKSELSILSGSAYEQIVQSFPRLRERHLRMKSSIADGHSDYTKLRYKAPQKNSPEVDGGSRAKDDGRIPPLNQLVGHRRPRIHAG